MAQRRIRHQLKSNETNQRPTRFLFVDIESRLEKVDDTRTRHRIWFGYAFYWRRRAWGEKDTEKWYRFETETEFWDLVCSRTKQKEPLHLICHNVNYDLGVLNIFTQLPNRGFELTAFYTSGHTSILSFVNGKQKIKVLDNGNYFPGALSRWGAAIGVEKMDVNPLTDPIEVVDPYCRRDTEILYILWKRMLDYLDKHDLGCWGPTLPSQAFHAYRHRFMTHPIYIHDNEEVLELEREAYHGGRTSVFYKGQLRDGPYYKLDINSMYPYVMHEHPYPNNLKGVVANMTRRELEAKLKRYSVVVDCEVETEEPVYPIKHKGHLVHPIGRFRTVLTTPEVKYALEKEYLRKVYKAAYYTQEPLFKAYVRFFYGQKVQYADDPGNPYYSFAKLYLNSLYGKFGQRAMEWEQLEPNQLLDKRTDVITVAGSDEHCFIYRFGPTYWKRTDGGESFNSFPAIAAHVTSYARLYLYRICERAGWENVYYTDTDSVITNQVGYNRLKGLLHTSDLGKLKIEKQSDAVTIKAPKIYEMGDEVRMKGIPRKAEEVEEDTYEFDCFPSFLSQARWEKGEQYHTERTRRHLTYAIYDGRETDRGWIEPLGASALHDRRQEKTGLDPRIAQIEARQMALEESLPLSHEIVFRMWDYRKGDFKRALRPQYTGRGAPRDISDSLAQEEGFYDLRELKEAILTYLDMRKEIEKLERQKNRIRRHSQSSLL